MNELLMFMSYVVSALLVAGFFIALGVLHVAHGDFRKAIVAHSKTWVSGNSVAGLVGIIITVAVLVILWRADYIALSCTIAIVTLMNVITAFIGHLVDNGGTDDE